MSIVPGCLLLLVCASCQHTADRLIAPQIEPELLSPRGPAPRVNAPTLLQSGPLPLAIIFDRGGKLRIVDATADRLLSSVTVPPRCVVSLDASAGITVGSKKIQPGPLPPDHRYEIWWDP